MISFFVEGVPVPQGSMVAFVIKSTGRAAMHPRDNGVYAWRQHVKHECAKKFGSHKPFAGPVAITLRFYLPRPKSISPKKRPLPCCKPDLDKLTRAILDALTGVAYEDDGQVCELKCVKLYSNSCPGVEVHIEELT